MYLYNREVVITNVDRKVLKSNNTEYMSVGFLDMEDRRQYDVSCKDEAVYSMLVPMKHAVIDLSLRSTNYGLRLSIEKVISIGDAI